LIRGMWRRSGKRYRCLDERMYILRSSSEGVRRYPGFIKLGEYSGWSRLFNHLLRTCEDVKKRLVLITYVLSPMAT
jgi:hypothetical protein